MVLVGDVGRVESRFGLFGYSVCVGAKLLLNLHQMYHRLKNPFGRTQWYS
jgi:hypothetical protein